MGYRDPGVHRAQCQLHVEYEEYERVALNKYGMSLYDLPDVLKWDVYGDVDRAVLHEADPKYMTNRRFESHSANWRRWQGWRSERASDDKRAEAKRLAVVEVRKKRSKRKLRARRFSGKRPEPRINE